MFPTFQFDSFFPYSSRPSSGAFLRLVVHSILFVVVFSSLSMRAATENYILHFDTSYSITLPSSRVDQLWEFELDQETELFWDVTSVSGGTEEPGRPQPADELVFTLINTSDEWVIFYFKADPLTSHKAGQRLPRLAPGNYAMKIESTSTTAYHFSFEVTKLPKPEINLIPEYGALLTGTIEQPGYTDIWPLELKSGSSLTIEIITLQQGEYGRYFVPEEHYMNVLNESGTIIEPSQKVAPGPPVQSENRVYDIQADGTYYIQILSESNDTFEYQFRVWNYTDPEITIPLKIGQLQHGTIELGKPEDAWSFSTDVSGETWLDVIHLEVWGLFVDDPFVTFSIHNGSDRVINEFRYKVIRGVIPILNKQSGNFIGDLPSGDYQIRVTSDIQTVNYSFQIRHASIASADRTVTARIVGNHFNKTITLRPNPIIAGWAYQLEAKNSLSSEAVWFLVDEKTASSEIPEWTLPTNDRFIVYRLITQQP